MNYFSLFFFGAVMLFLSSCTPQESISVKPDGFEVSGEFLFEGPNTLQASNNITLESLKTQAQSDGEITQARVSAASFALNGVDPAAIESATLQIVSKNHDMISLGTISAIDAQEVKLNMAEETDVTAYLTDDDATWVLDVNLTQDFDDMTLPLTLEFAIN